MNLVFRRVRLSPVILVLLCSVSCAARGQSTAPASLFDPARHMRISEVKPGMKGYGLSIFQGTRIDRFDVEVISVLHNFNPREDVVLIRCHGQDLEHTGPIAGMSGSPIYLTDTTGKSRLIGAFAFGWSLLKDPIAGVQPIEYMLDIGTNGQSNPSAPPAGMRASSGVRYVYNPFKYRVREPEAGLLSSETDGTQLHPLATPLMMSGLSPRLIEHFRPLLREQNLSPLQSGVSASTSPTSQPARMEPGSVLAAPLVSGDISMTAIGTCTEVIGNRVFGFGHPFNNEGPISLPMATGEINAIIPVLSQSFKIGSVTEIQGTLLADESAGVAGQFGKGPPMIPMDLRVFYTDHSLDMTYHTQVVSHPKLTSVLSAMAAAAALTGRRDLPVKHTLDYSFDFQFDNGRSVKMTDVATNVSDTVIMRQLQTVLDFVADNPFEKVAVEKITATMNITPEAREAEILSASLNKTKFRPGETMQIFVRCRPYRGEEKIIPVDIELGHDLRDGKYQLSVSDPESYIQEEQLQRPFRFSTESIQDVFAVLNDIGAIREDAMYLRLVQQPDGVAVGRTAMPNLPVSRRQVFLDSGRSDVSPLVSAAAKTVMTGMVMSGSADLDFEIDAGQHVEKRPPARAAHPKPQPLPDEETDEP